jgi:hypothetical protein
MSAALQLLAGSPISELVDPFPRLCQASMMMGRVLSHNFGEEFLSEDAKFEAAEQLYTDASNLARKITEEAEASKDYLSLASPLALTFSTLCTLCDIYSCPPGCKSQGKGAAAMQSQAIEGLKTVSRSVVVFVDSVNAATPLPQDLDRISPIIMDALYSAAANYAWMVRESGDELYQRALDTIRNCLRRLGTRWRNAAEYVRILEAQEFSYAVGSAS